MFISEAMAQTGATTTQGNLIMGYLPVIIVFAIFYFLFIRPQNKRMRDHQEMVSSLRRGDKIVTTGGIHAEIIKVNEDDTLVVEISDGVKVKLAKSYIGSLVNKNVKNSNDVTRSKAKK